MDPTPPWLDEPEPPVPDAPVPDDADPWGSPGADPRAPERDRGLATGVTSREELAARITDRLNPEQARAVTTTEGPLLILAGAGSGKTRVVAHRVAYLVGVKNVAPWRILAVTFTNKAAGEMRERIIALVGADDGRKVEMGTFHALCARILRRDGSAIGLSPRFVIYDTDDQQSLMKQVFRDLDLPIQGGVLRPRAVLEAISRAKNNLETVEDLVEGATTHFEREIARIATSYAARLRAAGALDFDDLLVETVRLLETQPEVLARYQARWRYLHVDEYQDTNAAQYRIVRALAAAHHNLCVVGDDDQSIYAWRGADLRNILDFERDEPGATVVKLEQNYRSTQLILDAAHAVVTRNEGRKDKKLWTERAGGRPIQRFEAYNEEEEAEWIARQVEALLGGRAATAHAAGGRAGEAAPEGDRRPLPHERPVPGDRGGVPALRPPLPAHRRDAVLPAPRGQGRAGLPAGPAQRHRRGQLRADHQPAGARHRATRPSRCSGWPPGEPDADVLERAGAGGGRGAARAGAARPRRRSPTSSPSCAGCGAGSASSPCPSSSTTSWRSPATGRCWPTGPRRTRSAGATSSSSAPSPRATTTWRPTTPSTGCWRRRPSSPTRTPTRPTPTPSP